jgi:hypothetical protein
VRVPSVNFVEHDLEGHVAAKPRIGRPIHLAHATCAKRRDDLIGSERATWNE